MNRDLMKQDVRAIVGQMAAPFMMLTPMLRQQMLYGSKMASNLEINSILRQAALFAPPRTSPQQLAEWERIKSEKPPPPNKSPIRKLWGYLYLGYLKLKKALRQKVLDVNVSWLAALDNPIQTAIKFCNPGGKIWLPGDTTFTINASIVDNGQDDITIEGAGTSTVLFLANGANVHVINLTSVDRWTIRNLKIDANKTNQAAVVCGLRAQLCNELRIENVWAYNANNVAWPPADPNWGCGILLVGCTESIIIGCHVEANGYAGIGLARETGTSQDCDHCIVVFNQVVSNGEDRAGENCAGIRTNRGDYLVIMGNTLRANHEMEINLRDANDYATVIGNTCEGNGANAYGINLTNTPRYCTIIGNVCYDYDDFGIRASGLIRSVIIGNVCYNSDTVQIVLTSSSENVVLGNLTRAGQYGISLTSGSDENLVEGNYCFDSTVYNIWIDNDSDDNSIFGNKTKGGGTGECRVNNVNCNNNHILGNDFNAVVVSDIGTGTEVSRANWDNV